jgi:large subunit ribosomal protein L6
MSRIGQKPILMPNGVTIHLKGSLVEVSGPKGKLDTTLNDGIKVEIKGSEIRFITAGDNPELKALMGLNRTLVNNAILGVTNLWSKSLELVGVGFRAQTDGRQITLSLGFSHPIKIIAPDGITFSVAENKITISGSNKYLVGEMAAKIRRLKPPEPYKGKGIKYVGEVIRKKAGKATKALGAATGGK